ncbi:MAG: Uma2 family endonuclease [Spirochaetaceae bacterium]|nr:Uma2 family endonuclease [Spirochaetaceae bacterium]
MSEQLPPQERYYTIEEYYRLPEDGPRAELEEGMLLMSTKPSIRHQDIAWGLVVQIGNYFHKKHCKAFYEIDVQLFADEATIYSPDIVVVCDRAKITRQQIVGAPDFIIEVGSPGTIGNDFTKKRFAYERAGVKEYWIVKDPNEIYCYLLNEEGYYVETVYRNEAAIKVQTFEDLTIDFSRLQLLDL